MKNLSLFVSAFALCASTSYAAIDCSTLPGCDSLGYKDKVADCPSSSEVLKCPFDTAWGNMPEPLGRRFKIFAEYRQS